MHLLATYPRLYTAPLSRTKRTSSEGPILSVLAEVFRAKRAGLEPIDVRTSVKEMHVGVHA